MSKPKIAVLDDNTRDAEVIGYAETEAEAAEVFMAYFRKSMDTVTFAELAIPQMIYRTNTSVISPAFEPL